MRCRKLSVSQAGIVSKWLQIVKILSLSDSAILIIISPIAIMLPFRGLFFCLHVCHVRAFFLNSRKYRHDFLCTRQPHMCLPDRVKIWLTSFEPFPAKCCPKLTHPCWFVHRKHSIANCNWMVRDSALVTMESLQYRKPASLFRVVLSLATSSFPKLGFLCTQWAMSSFAKLFWSLF